MIRGFAAHGAVRRPGTASGACFVSGKGYMQARRRRAGPARPQMPSRPPTTSTRAPLAPQRIALAAALAEPGDTTAAGGVGFVRGTGTWPARGGGPGPARPQMPSRPPSTSSGDPIADKRFAIAAALAETGDTTAAAEVLVQALEITPGWAAGWLMLADWRERLGDRDTLIAYIRPLLGDRRRPIAAVRLMR